MKKIASQIKKIRITNIVLWFLWAFGLMIAILLIYTILEKKLESSDKLIGALAILISAGIASASVMKNIVETKDKEQEKSEKEKERKKIFAQKVMGTIFITIDSLSHKAKSTPTSMIYEFKTDFKSNTEATKKLIDLIFSESILPYLPDEKQKIISDFYSIFYRFFSTYEFSLGISSTILTFEDNPSVYIYTKILKSLAREYIDLQEM